MPKVRRIPLGTYQSGTRSFGPWAFPRGLNGFDIRIGRCTTDTPDLWTEPDTRIRVDLQFSFDGGATYTPIGDNSWEGSGGVVTKRGQEVAESVVSWRFSIAGENGQQVPYEPTHAKASVTVINGPVRTYLDVTVET